MQPYGRCSVCTLQLKQCDAWKSNAWQGVTLGQHGCDIDFDADADKLKQILINLADSAIKFTRAALTVQVHADADSAGLRIRVEDARRASGGGNAS